MVPKKQALSLGGYQIYDQNWVPKNGLRGGGGDLTPPSPGRTRGRVFSLSLVEFFLTLKRFPAPPQEVGDRSPVLKGGGLCSYLFLFSVSVICFFFLLLSEASLVVPMEHLV